jgi:hypothetical protein
MANECIMALEPLLTSEHQQPYWIRLSSTALLLGITVQKGPTHRKTAKPENNQV